MDSTKFVECNLPPVFMATALVLWTDGPAFASANCYYCYAKVLAELNVYPLIRHGSIIMPRPVLGES